MNADAITLRGRRKAESLMKDKCVVTRPGRMVTDPETGSTSYERTPVYGSVAVPGVCKVQAAQPIAAQLQVGPHTHTVESLQVHLPVTSQCRIDDEVEIISAHLDPDLDGAVFRLVELARGSYRTADRWNVEFVTR